MSALRIAGDSQSGAIFSDDGKYRFRLWRCWAPELPRACFVLLNPSTADEVNNDPTIERQIRRVKTWAEWNSEAFGSVEIVNAFALRSTDPSVLYRPGITPVGDHNDESIKSAASEADESGGLIVCGWGSHARKLLRRHYALLELLQGLSLYAFGLNDDGTPVHPLYQGYDVTPKRWRDGKLLEDAA